MAHTAVVTGATGYVATELVKQLLEKGYIVRGTLRSLASKEKYSHLLDLGKALPGKLTLHEADQHILRNQDHPLADKEQAFGK
ncbi:probable dihydroflavonol 4-reductase [Coccomyxa sp. Obi]|nr:probable dihydroflavonol 4-reductase [Coccomyxa sp. Obi]